MTITNKTLVALALLGCMAASAQAGVHLRYQCQTTARGDCPTPPAPPVPPVPPVPPAPPAPPPPPGLAHEGSSHFAPPALPTMPEIPAPPAPPAPPPLPEVPAAAHAACAGKADGTRLTHVLGKGKTMTGVCEVEDGKAVFRLRAYRVED